MALSTSNLFWNYLICSLNFCIEVFQDSWQEPFKKNLFSEYWISLNFNDYEKCEKKEISFILRYHRERKEKIFLKNYVFKIIKVFLDFHEEL